MRDGLRFHNGDPFTADDVKWSFHRYRGVAAKLLQERVKAVEVVDPHRVRFVLHAPWPDFLAFYGTPATGAAWIVPKKYIEKVGEEGFKRHPIGLGPYKFVRLTPGIEMVIEANEQYWRKKPSVKRIVIKGVPDRTTRLAMLKTGEADIAYLMVGVEAQTVKEIPNCGSVRSLVCDLVARDSPTNGIRNPLGTIAVSGWRRTSPSTSRAQRGRAHGPLRPRGRSFRA